MKSPRVSKALFSFIVVVVIVFSAATPATAINIVEYTIPTAGSQPYRITTGPDGNLWFAEANGNKIGKITPAGVFTEYTVPTAASSPFGITTGPDGNLWFTEYIGNNIGRLTTAGVFTEFAVPTANSWPAGIVTGPDGNLWFTEFGGNKVGKITTAGVITEYVVGSEPFNIVTGPDGNLWFTEYGGNNIAKITTAGVLTEYLLPTGGSGPVDITVGSDNNLWFTEYTGNKIGKVTTAGIFTEYAIPTAGGVPYGITTGSDGNLWFTEHVGDKIGKMTTAGVFTEFTVPTSGSFPFYITAGPDNALWFTEYGGSKIGKLNPDAIPPIVISTSLMPVMSGLSSFAVTFSENMYDPSGNNGIDDVTNPANYLLVEDGADGIFNTASCAGGVIADDVKMTPNTITYIPNTAIVDFGSAIPNGNYRLFVCGTTSIRDTALNALGGGIDYTFNFTVGTTSIGANAASIRKGVALPRTGFAPNVVTSLPPQPANRAYAELDSIWLEIPTQRIKAGIVGVLQTSSGWDTTWLGNEVGWLNGTAFPSWEGNSVITGHVYNSDGLPGPFANIKDLKYGDQIIVHLYGEKYIFEVRATRLVRPETTNYALEHLEDASYLTLVTCQGYNSQGNTYRYRRVVRAVLVDVQAE